MVIFLQGLKTGAYYLRTKPAASPIQFTVNKQKKKERVPGHYDENESPTAICSNNLAKRTENNDDNAKDDTFFCMACSS